MCSQAVLILVGIAEFVGLFILIFEICLKVKQVCTVFHVSWLRVTLPDANVHKFEPYISAALQCCCLHS